MDTESWVNQLSGSSQFFKIVGWQLTTSQLHKVGFWIDSSTLNYNEFVIAYKKIDQNGKEHKQALNKRSYYIRYGRMKIDKTDK